MHNLCLMVRYLKPPIMHGVTVVVVISEPTRLLKDSVSSGLVLLAAGILAIIALRSRVFRYFEIIQWRSRGSWSCEHARKDTWTLGGKQHSCCKAR